jgi:hypothetical protein
MDRRTFNKLAGLAAIAALTENVELTAEQAAAVSGEVILQDQHLLVAFDPASGALTRLQRKSTRWSIQRRPALGASFRLLAPLPERRDNFVFGTKQRAASVEKISDRQVRLEWKDILSEHGGVLPIAFTATVTLQDGVLTFEGNLQNDSNLPIETIDYPYFGDLNAPTRDTLLRTEHMWYGNLVGDEIYPHFRNEKGYWGVDFPTKTVGTNQSLLCLLQAPQQGIYIGMHDASLPYYLEFTSEQHPGVVQSIDANVPRQDEISGIPVHLEFRTCHFVFAHPHTTVKLAPIVLRTYNGDWHAGMDVYKEWRSTWFVAPHLPAWVKDVHSWLQLQINAPEEDFTIPFNKLVQYGEQCAQNGVGAIQLVGWNRGGQDRGDPALDPDPGLGTWRELHDAIAKIQSQNVKVILFGKPIWADRTTEFYKTELYKYECTDPYGIPYQQGGYSYTTPTQLAGINNRRRSVMDVDSQAYRDIATKEFQKIVDLGAQGWLFDEVCHHGGVLYNFSPDHGYTAPGYTFAGDMPMARQFRAAADRVNPDFIFAGEGPQDWLLQNYPVSYFRINADSRPVCRYLDSQAPLVVAVTGIDDREMLNLILLNRYIISYEPYNFKGHVTDFPLTFDYGKKIDALRRKYKAFLWDAEFRDTLGANVTADGSVRHTVFRTAAGKRAVALANMEFSKTITASLDLANPGTLLAASPEQPEARPVTSIAALRIPPRSALVVMEQ